MAGIQDRIKEAMIAAFHAEREYCRQEDETFVTLDGLFDMDKVAQAAARAIFDGSDFTTYNGVVYITRPDLPVHYWDGEQLREVEKEQGQP